MLASEDFKLVFQNTVTGGQNIILVQNCTTADMLPLSEKSLSNRYLIRKFTRYGIFTVDDSRFQTEGDGQTCYEKLKKKLLIIISR